jgi:pimeloyl-ACP methyl ester carboxylesterase
MSARKLSLLVALSISGCGGGGNTPDAGPDAVDYTLGEAPQLAMPCTDSLTDVYTLPTGLPAMDDSHRGDVFRCSVTEKLTVPEVKAQLAVYNEGYPMATPGTVKTGFWTYRIAYRSTRNTVNNARAEGDMAAVLIIPAKPIDGAPLVVFGHGSVGVASKCAPSRLDLSGGVQDQDYPTPLYRLAAYGFPVIAPDYSGYSYGQTIGYFNAEDEAHAILDATRAAAKLLPSPPEKVVFVGHSQGGHAVLSAQSYAKSYGMSGNLVGVATLAPFWSSMSIWAAVAIDGGPTMLTTAGSANTILYAMEYAYAAGELRAPGTGVSVFKTSLQTAARDVFLNECYDGAGLQALGDKPSDIFDSTYVNSVGGLCALSFTPDCGMDPAAMWKARWAEDRPPIDGKSAPILAYFGTGDQVVTLGRAGCAQKKIKADIAAVAGATTNVTYCKEENAGHRDIVRSAAADYVMEWVAAKAGVGPEPAACTPLPATQACEQPPNDY